MRQTAFHHYHMTPQGSFQQHISIHKAILAIDPHFGVCWLDSEVAVAALVLPAVHFATILLQSSPHHQRWNSLQTKDRRFKMCCDWIGTVGMCAPYALVSHLHWCLICTGCLNLTTTYIYIYIILDGYYCLADMAKILCIHGRICIASYFMVVSDSVGTLYGCLLYTSPSPRD